MVFPSKPPNTIYSFKKSDFLQLCLHTRGGVNCRATDEMTSVFLYHVNSRSSPTFNFTNFKVPPAGRFYCVGLYSMHRLLIVCLPSARGSITSLMVIRQCVYYREMPCPVDSTLLFMQCNNQRYRCFVGSPFTPTHYF